MIYDLRFKILKFRLTSCILHLTSKAGFSLIELLVVFSLVTVISGVGFAAFVSYSRKQTIIQASGQVKEIVDSAKFNALSSVKPSSCSSEDQLSGYKVIFCSNALCVTPGADYEASVVCGGSETVIKSGKLSDNITFSNDGVSDICGTIMFSVISGITQGVPCQINVNGYGNQSIVTIDSTGHVSY